MLQPPAFAHPPEQEIVGYHGTTFSKALSIINREISVDYWRKSDNEYDWLGPGAYFFQDAPIRALLFAERRADQLEKMQGVSDKPAVVRARFRLGTCLDLLDASAATYIRFVHELMRREY